MVTMLCIKMMHRVVLLCLLLWWCDGRAGKYDIEQNFINWYQLLKTYTLNDKPNAVVALRARRIAFCASSPYRVTKYHSWPVVLSYNKMEMLLLPTGTGGVLYQPKQFTKLVFSKPFWYATGTADDMMFRLAAMVKNIPVLLGCSMLYQKGRVVRSCSRDSVDRMYDSVYGPNSTMYYNKLLAEVPKRVVTVYNITNIINVDSNSTSDSSLNAVQTSNTTVDYNRAAGTSVRSENGEHLDVLGALDSQRRLYNLKSALKRQQRSGNETELFTINRNGGNDLAWKLATDVLKALFKFNFDSVVRDNIHEREEVCYSNRTVRTERYCGIFDCEKKSGGSGSDSIGSSNGSNGVLVRK